MEIPVAHTFHSNGKDEEVLFPLLTTSELTGTYATLKQRRLQSLKDSIKDVAGIDPLKQVEMLQRERAQFYNIYLLVDYAGTLEGMEQILRLSLSKSGKDTKEIDRIMSLPITVMAKERIAVQILNPTEDGEAPVKVVPGTVPADDPLKNIQTFGTGSVKDVIEGMANVAQGPP